MPRRKTPNDYHALAKQRGFKWLGPEVRNTTLKTGWECLLGHQWETTYGLIQQGYGCPHCSGHVRKTAEDYHTLADERDFRWLGPMPRNIHVNTRWECQCGYRWSATYANIQRGHGCPACAGCASKTSLDYHALAKERGFRWVGKLPRNTESKTTWECQFSHRWKATYHSLQHGNGCPYCYGNAPLTENDYHTLAESRGFRWVGDNAPNNNHTPTMWECEQNHRWEATYHNVKSRGSGCPHCRDLVNSSIVSTQQRKIYGMIGGKLNYPVDRRKIDVALPDMMIAIEYDSFYYHGGEQERDAKRNKDLIAAGWRVLSIKSNKLLPTRKQLDVAVAALLRGSNYEEIVLTDWGQGSTKT